MKFIIHWSYSDRTARHEGTKAFSEMPAGDAVGDGGENIELIGRWHAANGYEGFLVCATDSAEALTKWVMAWNSVLDLDVTPCLDDEELKGTAREFFS